MNILRQKWQVINRVFIFTQLFFENIQNTTNKEESPPVSILRCLN